MSTIQFFLKKIATLRVRLIARVTHFTRVPTRARAIARVSLTGLYDHHYTNKIQSFLCLCTKEQVFG